MFGEYNRDAARGDLPVGQKFKWRKRCDSLNSNALAMAGSIVAGNCRRPICRARLTCLARARRHLADRSLPEPSLTTTLEVEFMGHGGQLRSGTITFDTRKRQRWSHRSSQRGPSGENSKVVITTFARGRLPKYC
jgi:hypothetical protein